MITNINISNETVIEINTFTSTEQIIEEWVRSRPTKKQRKGAGQHEQPEKITKKQRDSKRFQKERDLNRKQQREAKYMLLDAE